MTIKKIFFAAIIVLAVACDKTSDTQSTWTINGTTYKEGSSPSRWDYAGSDLTATDNVKNGDIEIIFVPGSKPTTGTYHLSYNDTCGICGPRCRIDVHVGSFLYTNLISSGATVSVTTGSGGKLIATFSGIPMTSSATLSGTIIER